MRRSLPIRLLLIFALLFSQMGGLVHGISHAMAEQDQSLPHDKLCDLCEAYAQLGSALGSHAISFTPTEQRPDLVDASFDTLHTTAAFAAFSARAPPYSA
ncbi:MAG: hypothetical protein WC216_06745 [Gallionella sp.]|jgi:hypothetical protein